MKLDAPKFKRLLVVLRRRYHEFRRIDLIVWHLFYPYKRDTLFKAIDVGMNYKFAYKKARATKRPKNLKFIALPWVGWSIMCIVITILSMGFLMENWLLILIGSAMVIIIFYPEIKNSKKFYENNNSKN